MHLQYPASPEKDYVDALGANDMITYSLCAYQGITNTVGAVPGIVGVALTGYLLDSTHSWSVSLFCSCIIISRLR